MIAVSTNLLHVFRKPSAEVLAVQELEDAKRELLAAQTGRDYAIALVAYNEDRVARLTAYLRGTAGDNDE